MATTSSRTRTAGAAIVAAATVGALAAGCSSLSGASGSSPGSAASRASPPATTTVAVPPSPSRESTSGRQPAGGTVAECATRDLKVAIGNGNAGAGHHLIPLRFTNTSPKACRIEGFPGVSYVKAADGKPVGKPAVRQGGWSKAVVLQPGQIASAGLDEVQTRNYDPNVCRPTRVIGLRVYPPNNTVSVLVEQPGSDACASTTMSGDQLKIKAVVPGANGA